MSRFARCGAEEHVQLSPYVHLSTVAARADRRRLAAAVADSDSFLHVAVNGDRAAGMVEGGWSRDGTYVNSVWVDVAARRQGIASALMAASLKGRPPEEPVRLWRTIANTASGRLWSRLGFVDLLTTYERA